jgi:1,4-alpha-glucan branching enzyme
MKEPVMQTPRSIPYPPSRLHPRPTQKPINFICLAPQATSVCLAGDFNHWHPANLPMEKTFDGSWRLTIPLRHGSHHYQFLVDGQPQNDDRAHGISRNSRGERVSLIQVS